LSRSAVPSYLSLRSGSTEPGPSIQNNGAVGIGTTLPGARQDVRLADDGDLLFDSPFNPFVNGRAPYIRFKCTSSTCLTNFNGGELNIQGGFDVPNGGRIRFGGGTRGDADVNVIQFLQATEGERCGRFDGGDQRLSGGVGAPTV